MTAGPSPKTSRQAAMVQVAGVGLGFVASLLLAGIFFLATGRGSDTETLWVFPLWALMFTTLIWRATSWRQPVARGLALVGAEFLALPLAWILYRGLPSLSGADPLLRQMLSVLALGLISATGLLAASLRLWGKDAHRNLGPAGRTMLALGGALYAGEALYGLVLLASALFR